MHQQPHQQRSRSRRGSVHFSRDHPVACRLHLNLHLAGDLPSPPCSFQSTWEPPGQGDATSWPVAGDIHSTSEQVLICIGVGRGASCCSCWQRSGCCHQEPRGDHNCLLVVRAAEASFTNFNCFCLLTCFKSTWRVVLLQARRAWVGTQ